MLEEVLDTWRHTWVLCSVDVRHIEIGLLHIQGIPKNVRQQNRRSQPYLDWKDCEIDLHLD